MIIYTDSPVLRKATLKLHTPRVEDICAQTADQSLSRLYILHIYYLIKL